MVNALPSTSAFASRTSRALLPSALIAVGVLLLPFVRPDRAFELFNWDLSAFSKVLWLAVLLLISSAGLSVLSALRLPMLARGYALIGISSGTALTVFAWLASTGSNFGYGALVALICLVLVLGVGLSETGLIQSDPFIASSIVLCSLFVMLFIAYPLFIVLRESIIVNGVFTLQKVQETLSSPLFMVLENKFTARSETMIVFAISASKTMD